MTPIYNTTDLLEYSKRLSRQKEILKISTFFSPIEKIEVHEAMETLEKIVNNRLATLQDIEEAINL